MKKIFLLIMVMVMLFTLVACGGPDNSENNALMQSKVDEADKLAVDLFNLYKDNGLLEGEYAAEFQAIVDAVTASINDIKTTHQLFLDEGGYTDKDTVELAEVMNTLIAATKEAIAETKAELKAEEDAVALTGKAVGILALTEMHDELVDIVNETSYTAFVNGWENDEELNSELEAVLEFLEIVSGDLEIPDSMDEEYIDMLITMIDELIPVWHEYLIIVSEPYTAG
ncbi:hypothetical protein SAMN05660297_03192 [Natronincola peptidivorans]|uniref:Uncharacterized protein n=1 Tax=Natronincola peptidivorans TaxID=426128 RepID=A0A1I0GGJ4_9FIRM|nr:hypothetical protein [Natronincola peptidivorans]SET70123.1 hypothetical protein SAMN05660297_03192 [Natronincola peptidivorans]